jgi:hypothetical protein
MLDQIKIDGKVWKIIRVPNCNCKRKPINLQFISNDDGFTEVEIPTRTLWINGGPCDQCIANQVREAVEESSKPWNKGDRRGRHTIMQIKLPHKKIRAIREMFERVAQ